MNKKIVGQVGVLALLVTTTCLLFYQANRNSPHMKEPRKECSHNFPLPKHYEVVYNYTCNRDYSKAVLPERLNSLDLKDDLNYQTTRTSLEYTTYIHIIAYGLVSNNGEVFRRGLKIAPRGCLEPSDQPPENANELELHDEVFVITQYWGSAVFHRMVEIIPRLVLYLDFLKRHPNVKIISPEGTGGRLEEILGILGLDKRRIRIGWCRAKIIYLPRPTRCGRANIQEVQVLSHHFRDYISKNFPFQDRNRVVLIRRSGSRRFTEQHGIEKVVETAAIDFNLSFAMFVDNPTPSFNDTMRLFKSAVMVVAPHGAGLSNILFSDPGTYVIEGVCNLPHLNLCFHRLARVLGHRWHGIPSRGGCEDVVDVSASAIQFTLRQYLPYLVHHSRSRTNVL